MDQTIVKSLGLLGMRPTMLFALLFGPGICQMEQVEWQRELDSRMRKLRERERER